MKVRLGVALMVAGVGLLGAAPAPVPDLPVWSDEDREALKNGGLLSGATLFERLVEEGVDPDAPLGLDPIETLRVAEPTSNPVTIADEFLGAYFDQRPAEFLVDPQSLLTRQEFADQLGFLDYHAGDSVIDLFIYVFDKEQEIPGEVRAEELPERLFGSGRPTAILYYYLGAPGRAKLFLTPEVAAVVPAAEQHLGIQSCVEAALDKANPVDQLADFAVQMSIRLYWMEQLVAPGRIPGEPLVAMKPRTARVAEPRGSALLQWVTPWLAPGGLLAALVLLVAGLRWWIGGRRSYRLPEFDHAGRLGGEHAAGIGAIISFTSTGAPPTVQRHQMPDYLRRT
jgi:hypothetical protein